MKRLKLLLLVLLTLVGSVSAHPGHGNFDGYMPIHYLTSPLHVVFILAFATGLIYLFKHYRKSIKQKK